MRSQQTTDTCQMMRHILGQTRANRFYLQQPTSQQPVLACFQRFAGSTGKLNGVGFVDAGPGLPGWPPSSRDASQVQVLATTNANQEACCCECLQSIRTSPSHASEVFVSVRVAQAASAVGLLSSQYS